MIEAGDKIRIPVNDNKKLTLKDYRNLIYKFMKDFSNEDEEASNNNTNSSLKNSLGPSKNLIETKKPSSI